MRRWVTILLFTAALTLAYIHRSNLSVALASTDFKRYLHLSDSERGLANSAFFWSYALLQIPAGLILDRFGVKRPVAVAIVLWCAVSGLTSAVTVFWQLLLIRILLGIGEAAIFPAGLSWIHRNVAEHRRGLFAGIFVSGAKWGPAIAAPLAAWLINAYGWRSMFQILGFGGLLLVVPWILFVDGGKRAVKRTPGEVTEWPFPMMFRSRVIWGTLIGTFAYNYFFFFAITWLPAYFVERRHLSLTSMGVYTMFSFAGTAIVTILAGAAADGLIHRGADAVTTRRWFTIAGLVAASTELIGALADSNQVASFFAVFSIAGMGLATANYWALTQTLVPSVAAGRVAGLQNTSLTIAAIVAPIITGWLKQITGSYNAPMQAIWVMLVIGVGSYLFLVRAERVPQVACVEPETR
jgi:ACS family D-galactonate transporter-like MFS transporter